VETKPTPAAILGGAYLEPFKSEPEVTYGDVYESMSQLPIRFQRVPLSDEEIAYINVSLLYNYYVMMT
jgi:hypothetical protein